MILLFRQRSPKELVKVLFEPNTVVVDSNTYDITAWAMPYAYGVAAYANKIGNPLEVIQIFLLHLTQTNCG